MIYKTKRASNIRWAKIPVRQYGEMCDTGMKREENEHTQENWGLGHCYWMWSDHQISRLSVENLRTLRQADWNVLWCSRAAHKNPILFPKNVACRPKRLPLSISFAFFSRSDWSLFTENQSSLISNNCLWRELKVNIMPFTSRPFNCFSWGYVLQRNPKEHQQVHLLACSRRTMVANVEFDFEKVLLHIVELTIM